MKKSTKRLCILGAGLCITGLLLCGAGFALGDTSFSNLTSIYRDNDDHNKTSYKLDKKEIADITSLDFDLKQTNLITKISDNDKFYIEYHIWSALKNDPISYKAENNRLEIKEKEPVPNQNMNTDDNEFILYVPKDSKLNNIKGRTDIGMINLNNLLCDFMDLNADVGSISLNNMEIHKGKTSSDVGEISIHNTSLSDFEAEADTGSIKADIGSLKHNVKLSSDIGAIDVTLRKKDNISIYAKTDTGNIKVSDNLGGTLEKDVTESYYNLKTTNPYGNLSVTVDTGNISIEA